MTDDRIFEAIDDLISFVEAGVNVVSSGPVVLQFPLGILDQKLLDRIAAAARRVGPACTSTVSIQGLRMMFWRCR